MDQTPHAKVNLVIGLCIQVRGNRFAPHDPSGSKYWPAARMRGICQASRHHQANQVILIGSATETEVAKSAILNYCRTKHLTPPCEITLAPSDRNTDGNMAILRSILSQGTFEPQQVVVVTSRYHLVRARRKAEQAGIFGLRWVSAETYLIHQAAQEGLVSDKVRQLRRYFKKEDLRVRQARERQGLADMAKGTYSPKAKPPET